MNGGYDGPTAADYAFASASRAQDEITRLKSVLDLILTVLETIPAVSNSLRREILDARLSLKERL